MIEVIDDFIPVSFQEEIKHNLLDLNFPWYFIKDTTYNNFKDGTVGAPAVSHLLLADGESKSQYWNAFSALAHLGAQAVNKDIKRIVNARTFLQFPLNEKLGFDPIDRVHIDIPQEHTVILYYVLDSDGDTILVDKKHTTEFRDPMEHTYTVDMFNVIKRVTPKQGRVLIFDGRYYHTAEQPKQNMRCVVNLNII